MSQKVMVFAFDGELMAFAHALLNVLDMNERGLDAKLIIESEACDLVRTLQQTDKPFADIFEKVKQAGLIEGVCGYCAEKLKILPIVQQQGLRLLDDMYGHPSIAKYIQAGYQIITF